MSEQSQDCMAANIRVVTRDGEPAIEMPDGSVVELRTTVKEWTHDSPMHGEHVSTQAETDADDFAWWTVYPERSDVMAADRERNFPEVVIEPHAHRPDSQSDSGEEEKDDG